VKIKNKIVIGGLIVIFLTIISTTLYSTMISEQIRQITLERAETSTASYVKSLAVNELAIEDFEPQNFDKKKSVFLSFFQHIKSDETVRIKVWAKDGTIIYSDDDEIIGKNFKENTRFLESIKGQITSEIKEPIDPENVAEVGYEQLIEIYVPIWLDSTQPIGVIELYCSLDSMNESIQKVNSLILEVTIILIGIISIGVILFSIVMSKFSQQDIQKEKFASIGQLSSRVAHDLRNPLSVIKNVIALDEISPPKTKEESNKRRKMIISAIERITHQIDGVMNFVKTTPLELENISVKTIIESVKNNMIIPINIKIIYEGDEPTIKCDVKLMEALFSNLISNSIYAMKSNGNITIKVIDDINQVILKVIDQGSGIAKANLKNIFNPLFTTKQEGTGLGLFSCKSIVEQHNGTITVNNNPTTFTIKLPKILDETG
jgi:signal transduction histidine kinase